MGVETTVEGGIGRNLFMRGGYTYLDAVYTAVVCQ